jgi:NAD(P)-dependent dehydrogenase (short-subunit alcohol dehydrogenase family)
VVEARQDTVKQLVDRVAVITGAGSGIGRSMAMTFAAHGAKILVNDIIAERAHATVAAIEKEGGTARAAVADIADEAAVTGFVADAIGAWGQIDILCNNAGIMDRMQLAVDVTTEEWQRIFAVNITGQFFVSRAVLPHMVARKRGSIINTASHAGSHGAAAGVAYVSSKHAVVGLTRSLAWTYRPDGIRVNAICPGAVQTDITGGRGLEDMDPVGAARLAPFMALTAKWTQPQNVANLGLFLASDASDYISGAIIPVDLAWGAA